MNKVILIGYSGHSYVVHSIFHSMGINVYGYCDAAEKDYNPFQLKYLGKETEANAVKTLTENDFFVSIGDNNIRRKISEHLYHNFKIQPVNAVHKTASICNSAKINEFGIMIAGGVIINPLSTIGSGSICNTGCIIEHECTVEQFVHIGPGAILCGNVHVGENSFIGAGSVVRQGIKIGKNVMVGAGSVVVKNVADNMKIMGCPAK